KCACIYCYADAQACRGVAGGCSRARAEEPAGVAEPGDLSAANVVGALGAAPQHGRAGSRRGVSVHGGVWAGADVWRGSGLGDCGRNGGQYADAAAACCQGAGVEQPELPLLQRHSPPVVGHWALGEQQGRVQHGLCRAGRNGPGHGLPDLLL
ncbi:hypothetical protein IWW55_006922, partial [Coemansia sp. RSA 2706]